MKRLYLLTIIPIAVVLWFMANASHLYVFAPELFGDGEMVAVLGDERVTGYIHAWGGWVIYGTPDDCTIVQVAGKPIEGVDGAIACYMDFSKPERFRGWIDFRGHRRKFCGGRDAGNLPSKCYGE